MKIGLALPGLCSRLSATRSRCALLLVYYPFPSRARTRRRTWPRNARAPTPLFSLSLVSNHPTSARGRQPSSVRARAPPGKVKDQIRHAASAGGHRRRRRYEGGCGGDGRPGRSPCAAGWSRSRSCQAGRSPRRSLLLQRDNAKQPTARVLRPRRTASVRARGCCSYAILLVQHGGVGSSRERCFSTACSAERVRAAVPPLCSRSLSRSSCCCRRRSRRRRVQGATKVSPKLGLQLKQTVGYASG